MRKTAGRIIKGSDVKVEGKFVIDIMPPEPESTKQTTTALVEPQVRVVKSESDFSIIEITCSCGTSMQLRCEYAKSKPSAAAPQNAEPKTPNPAE